MNEFYNHASFPTQGSVASSASMRAELDAVAAGFDKLPPLSGNGGKTVKINASGTGLEAVTVTGNLPLTTSILKGDGVGGAAGASAAEIVSTIGATAVANATNAATAANATALAGTTPTAAGLALLDDASPSAQRATLGLGTAATSASTAFAASGAITSSGLTQSTGKLIGRTTASTGAPEEITVGSGLSLSAGTLSVTASSGITLGTVQASTSGTSRDFTGIPAGVKRITVMFAGVRTNGTANLLLQIGDSGGIENTGYVSGAIYSTTLLGGSAGFVCTGFRDSTSEAYSGSVVLTLLDSSANTWVCQGDLTTSAPRVHSAAGHKSLSAALDRLSITTVGGSDTFNAGSINILYE